MFVKEFKLAALLSLSLVAYTSLSAAPVNSSCTKTTSTDLPAYCSSTTNTRVVNIDKLYRESDNIFGVLVDELCPITNCGHECEETLTFQLTEDRDEQNDAINTQLIKIKGQVALLDSICKNYIDITSDENRLMYGLCTTLRSKLQHFTENVAQYLENEKCGCNSKCHYVHGCQIDSDDVSPQQLPCTVYSTIKFTQEVISAIRMHR